MNVRPQDRCRGVARPPVRICAKRASIGCFRAAGRSSFRRLNRCSKSISRSRSIVLADRIVIRPDSHQRMVDTVEICYREAAKFSLNRPPWPIRKALHFSEKFACKMCGQVAAKPEPTLFSFNNPMGACPTLPGLRQHGRLRFGPDYSGSDAYLSRKARLTHGRSRNTAGITTKSSSQSARAKSA